MKGDVALEVVDEVLEVEVNVVMDIRDDGFIMSDV